MARNAFARPSKDRARPRPTRRSRALAFPLLVLALPGCETLERMDYWDRFFEPVASRQPPAAAAVEPTRPDPDPAPATDWASQPGPVVAMEPRPNPPSTPAADLGSQTAPVRGAEPRPNTAAPVVDTDPEARTRRLVRQNPWLTL